MTIETKNYAKRPFRDDFKNIWGPLSHNMVDISVGLFGKAQWNNTETGCFLMNDTKVLVYDFSIQEPCYLYENKHN